MEIIAVKSTFVAAILYLSFGVLSPLNGVTAFGALGAELPPDQMENTLILMAIKFLPPVLTAVFVAALASALMSTSHSSMLAGATMFTQNVAKPFKPDLSDRAQLNLALALHQGFYKNDRQAQDVIASPAFFAGRSNLKQGEGDCFGSKNRCLAMTHPRL